MGVAEKATGERWVGLGLGGLLALFLTVGRGGELLCRALGLAYPTYASMKAIKTVEKDDDTRWLIYWTVFSVFSLMDVFCSVYWLTKAVFLFWLWCPASMGAQHLHTHILAPLMDKYGHLSSKDEQAPAS